MELRQYWHLLRKWIWLLVVGALVGGGLAFLVSSNTTPVYQASTILLVTPGSAQTLDSYSSLIASERLAQTYAELLKSAPVLAETRAKLALGSAEDLAADRVSGFSVSAEPVRDTQLLRVAVTGTDPDLISSAANILVQVFIEWQAEVQRARYAESKANLVNEMEQVQASIQETQDRLQALQAAGGAQTRMSWSACRISWPATGIATRPCSAAIPI